jgi:hypothetical protein
MRGEQKAASRLAPGLSADNLLTGLIIAGRCRPRNIGGGNAC